jgi:hypothetical protein
MSSSLSTLELVLSKNGTDVLSLCVVTKSEYIRFQPLLHVFTYMQYILPWLLVPRTIHFY